MAGDVCDACGRTGTQGVFSSVCGAVSFAYCLECCEFHAEPAWAVAFVLEQCNGDWANVSKWFKDTIQIYKDGKYVPCTELKLEAECPECHTPSFKPTICFSCFHRAELQGKA